MAGPDQNLSRRRFLQAAAATTTVASFPRAAWAQQPPSDHLGLAVVGCGGIARHHGPNLTAPFAIRAVCEVDQVRGEAFVADFAPDAPLLADYREAIGRPDVDAVLICTPDHWHAAIAAEALRAGKDVYCEKPLTLTIEEGVLLRDLVAETGRVLQVGTQQRSSPDFQTAAALVRQGRIGAVRRVTAAIGAGPYGGPFPAVDPPPTLDWNHWLGPAPEVAYRNERCHGNFRWWYEYSGGKMTDWGAHHVDIALWAVNLAASGEVAIEPISVEHATPLADGMPTTEDHYNTATQFHVRCTLPGGVELDIRDTATDLGFENGILFEGDEGRFFVNRGKLTGAPIEQLAEAPLPEGALSDLRHGRPVATHFANFYQAWQDRRSPISDAASHVRHLNVCHAANVAMRLGEPLVWRPGTDEFADPQVNQRWRTRPRRAGYELA